MGLKNDKWITEYSVKTDMIKPFVPSQVRVNENNEKVVSYGVSSYGYDTRLAPEFITTRRHDELVVLDPKKPDERAWSSLCEGNEFVIPAHGFVLTRTIEYFKIPKHVLCVVLGKSTYARLGLVVNATPLEPGWEGHITLELSNTTPLPLRVYANEGIAQILFLSGDEEPSVTYDSRSGKYQGQLGVVLSRI